MLLRMEAVGIADLKAHLSEHLRAVQRGASVTVLDRRRPIARIIPWSDDPEALRVRAATRAFGTVSACRDYGVDAHELERALQQERQADR